MEFDHYDYVPQLQADKIIAAAKAGRAGRRRSGRRIRTCSVTDGEWGTSEEGVQDGSCTLHAQVDAVVTAGVA